MSLRRAVAIIGTSAFGAALCLLTPACDIDDRSGEPPEDGGAPRADAGASDMDASPSPQADAMVPAGEEEYDSADGLASARAACFDGEDNNNDGVADCDDPSCQANVPSCCVGTSSPVCCTPDDDASLPFAACTGDLSTCEAVTSAGYEVFGAESPRAEILGGDLLMTTLLPGGMGGDSGVLFPGELDPRAGVIRLSARIASSLEPPADGAIDALAFGLVDATVDPASLARVSPVAAVVVSRNRQEVSLVVGGETVERWMLLDDAFHVYELSLAPDGVVSLESTGLAQTDEGARALLMVDRPLRVVVYGRTPNPGAAGPLPVRAAEVRVRNDVCDMPGALTRAGATAVPAPGDEAWALGHGSIASPHVIAYEDPAGTPRQAMALMVDSEIHLAEPVAGGFALTSAIGSPVFDPTGYAWAADGVSDPALRFADGALELWLTGWSGEAGTVARAVWDDASGRFDSAEVVLDPAGIPEIIAFDGAAPFEHAGALHVAVRERRDEGSRIAVYGLGGASPARTAEVAAPSGDLFAFDRDEVAAPGVAVEGGVIRVYYAGRRGTRWSIGLVVSDDGQRWRTPAGSPVLGPSDAGFDAIGVSEPSPVNIDGTLRLYYAGLDGARARIGLATGR